MQNGKYGKIKDMDLDFFKNKRIFITGYNGFKGSWISKILVDSGAILCGYALKSEKCSLFNKINISSKIRCIEADIRDYSKLKEVFCDFNPEIVLHLAAQPIVIKSYGEPHYTYETNVMGTVNILECVRNANCVKSFLNITTDKVYENLGYEQAFKEEDKLNGYDPYSNSKSCSELITSSYRKSFLEAKGVSVSTARAGNTIGGGDVSEYRIIPDCVRAAKNNKEIFIRNPNSVRPYQHVLDVAFAYLMIVKEQYNNIELAGCYNIGPNKAEIIKTEELVKLFCNYWRDNISYHICKDKNIYESPYLQLDCDKLRNAFNWKPVWNIEKSVKKVVEFEKYDENSLEECMEKQIAEFLKDKMSK